ncbi:MAG TPA: hypothetical protein VHH36_01645 [Candidatus Thermoplasmatota archaeon]|nr:hypothetical protein [Candidatus Thermoplasmatota archaeon]
MRPLPALLVAFAALAAGCAAPGAPPAGDAPLPALVPDRWWETAVPSSAIDEAHNHSDRAHHRNLTTANFEVVGWDPLVTDFYGETARGMGCGGAATREDGRRIAIVQSIETDVAFVVADVTDPTTPVKLGEYVLPNVIVWDADVSADGMHVIVAADPPIFPQVPQLPPVTLSAPLAVRPLWRDACTGETREAGPQQYVFQGGAVAMVGIQDPSAPVLEDWVPQPYLGPHSVGSHLIDGRVYVTSSVTNLAHEGSYYSFFEIVSTPAGDHLAPLSVLEAPGHPGVGMDALNLHVDAYLHKHPVTGRVLAYLANWDAMYVYDVTDMRTPMPVSEWRDGDADEVHTTFPFPELRDGRQILVVGQEVEEPADLPSGWIYLLDVTDPAAPAELGRWTLPVKPNWDDGGLQFSPHYVAVQNDTMFVANYHGGLWAVDVSDLAAPRASGLFVPDRDSPQPFGGAATSGPSVEDVILGPDGLLTVWDYAGGIYQIRFRPEVPAPRAPAWPAANASAG